MSGRSSERAITNLPIDNLYKNHSAKKVFRYFSAAHLSVEKTSYRKMGDRKMFLSKIPENVVFAALIAPAVA
jgi:hypothetical protein